MTKKIFILFLILGELMANSLPKFYTETLDNGLQVVAIPMDNGTQVVSTDIYYKVGSRNEVMGKSGIAHMLEHLNFKSTKEMKAGEFDEIVKGFGGVNNASTGFDYTHYFINSSSSNMDKSLSLFADMLENLALKDEEFQPERDVVTEERLWRTDNNPIGYLYFRLFNNMFLYHPYHWTPIGFMNDIKNWTIEDIRNFHSTFYQPKNAIILVSGDIKKDEVFASAKKYFANIKNSVEIPKVHMVEPVQDGKKEIIIHKKSEVEMIAITFHIPNFLHKDQVALSVLSEVLSSGKSSILNKDLIDKKQLVNTIYSYNMELVDAGVYLFMAVCNSGIDANDVKKELLEHINNIKSITIKQEELDKIKLNTKYDFITSLESASDVSSLFGGYLAKGDITPLLTYEDDLQKVTPDDLKEVAQKYFTEKNMTIVILKDEEK
jgi:predicted Zn-dependent peptidase